MSRIKRLQGYARPFDAVSGFSSKKADLDYWARRSSQNSYHGKGEGPQSRMQGKSDLNHVGGSFEPKVRRSGE